MSAKQLKDQQHLIKNFVQLLDKCVSQNVFCFLGNGFWVLSKFSPNCCGLLLSRQFFNCTTVLEAYK